MQIALALYPRFTALDIVGPFQTLADLPGVECVFVAEQAGPVIDHTGRLSHRRDRDRSTRSPRPTSSSSPAGSPTRPPPPTTRSCGGSARCTPRRHGRRACAPARSSSRSPACSTVLDATTHWSAYERLRALGAHPTEQRVVERGQGDHRRRRVVRDRHGPHAGRHDVRRRGRAGDPAGDRVRPAAAVRRRRAEQGARPSSWRSSREIMGVTRRPRPPPADRRGAAVRAVPADRPGQPRAASILRRLARMTDAQSSPRASSWSVSPRAGSTSRSSRRRPRAPSASATFGDTSSSVKIVVTCQPVARDRPGRRCAARWAPRRARSRRCPPGSGRSASRGSRTPRAR